MTSRKVVIEKIEEFFNGRQRRKETRLGEKKGVRNKATAARETEIAATGLTPLEYMLRVLRDETLDRATRLDAASKAGPYVHPKLAAIAHSGLGTPRIVHLALTTTDPVEAAKQYQRIMACDS